MSGVRGRYKRHDGRDDWKTIRVSRVAESPLGVTIIPSGDTPTSMSVHNLQSNTVYKFMILSRNRLGDGLFSATITATTKGQHRACGPKLFRFVVDCCGFCSTTTHNRSTSPQQMHNKLSNQALSLTL